MITFLFVQLSKCQADMHTNELPTKLSEGADRNNAAGRSMTTDCPLPTSPSLGVITIEAGLLLVTRHWGPQTKHENSLVTQVCRAGRLSFVRTVPYV